MTIDQAVQENMWVPDTGKKTQTMHKESFFHNHKHFGIKWQPDCRIRSVKYADSSSL